MAYISYVPVDQIRPEHEVPDRDNIIRIHGQNPKSMRSHYDLYVDLMRRPGPLSREQREMIAVLVSGINGCHY